MEGASGGADEGVEAVRLHDACGSPLAVDACKDVDRCSGVHTFPAEMCAPDGRRVYCVVCAGVCNGKHVVFDRFLHGLGMEWKFRHGLIGRGSTAFPKLVSGAGSGDDVWTAVGLCGGHVGGVSVSEEFPRRLREFLNTEWGQSRPSRGGLLRVIGDCGLKEMFGLDGT